MAEIAHSFCKVYGPEMSIGYGEMRMGIRWEKLVGKVRTYFCSIEIIMRNEFSLFVR